MHPLRALKAIVHDAVDATVELVREGNDSAARQVRAATAGLEVEALVHGVDDVRRVVTSGVLGSVKVVNRMVEFASDAALDVAGVGSAQSQAPPVRLRSRCDGPARMARGRGPGRAQRGGGGLPRRVQQHAARGHERARGRRVPRRVIYAQAWEDACASCAEHLCVFVHGLGSTEWSWALGSQAYYGSPQINLSTEVACALGASAVYVRYNTGCALEENGRRLAALLERLGDASGATQLTLIGHSMGGVVLRHACHVAQAQELAWGARVRDVAYLGSPHEGAPLAAFGVTLAARLGSVDLPATRIISRILDGRSTGTKDLAYGMSVAMREQLPLSCTHHFVLGTIMEDAGARASRLVGDLLVRPSSASGSGVDASSLDCRVTHHGGLLHHHLQNHPAVGRALIASLKA